MNNVTAVISMLHEGAATNSAARFFRQQPVLAWTLQRLWMCEKLDSVAILCWEDQLEQLRAIAEEGEAHVLSKNPRMHIGPIESVAAARRWADGWRGGLLASCDFDLGFHGPWVQEVVQRLTIDAIVLIDPSAGLVDAKIISDLIEHAGANEKLELCFTQAAPGLGGVLLRPSLIEKLAVAQTHPGRVLHYLPDMAVRDPIGSEGCVAVPTSVARSTRNFRLDSDRQIERLTQAAVHLNGQLVRSDSEDLVNRLRWTAEVDELPREIVLELNTNRTTSPIFWPGKSIQRPPLTVDIARRIFEQVGDDVRLSLVGVGDPLLHEQVFEIIAMARQAGIKAIQLETDLLPADALHIDRLVDSEIDVVSVHLPAMSQATYAAIMGADRFLDVIENMRRFVSRRQSRARAVPLLAPLFNKTQQNLGEMEMWYDQWLQALGAAVIVGPSTYGGLIPEVAVADMSPPRRKPCARLWSRMTILSNGKVVSCEQDVTGRQVVGDVTEGAIREIWRDRFSPLRSAHRAESWSSQPICVGCREWHR